MLGTFTSYYWESCRLLIPRKVSTIQASIHEPANQWKATDRTPSALGSGRAMSLRVRSGEVQHVAGCISRCLVQCNDTRRLLRRCPQSEGTNCLRRTTNSVQLAGNHAGDRDPNDPCHARRGILVSFVQ